VSTLASLFNVELPIFIAMINEFIVLLFIQIADKCRRLFFLVEILGRFTVFTVKYSNMNGVVLNIEKSASLTVVVQCLDKWQIYFYGCIQIFPQVLCSTCLISKLFVEGSPSLSNSL